MTGSETSSAPQSHAVSIEEVEVVYWNDLWSLKPEARVHMQSPDCALGCIGRRPCSCWCYLTLFVLVLVMLPTQHAQGIIGHWDRGYLKATASLSEYLLHKAGTIELWLSRTLVEFIPLLIGMYYAFAVVTFFYFRNYIHLFFKDKL